MKENHIEVTGDGRQLPGFKKKSFQLNYNNGEIWCEHLDGLYGFSDLVMEKFNSDYSLFKRPSSSSYMAINIDETVITQETMDVIVDKLLNGDKAFTKICVVGADGPTKRQLKKHLSSGSFILGFTNDFEKAKEWLI